MGQATFGGNTKLHVYYSVNSSKGGQSSVVQVTECSVQTIDDYVDSGNFWASGSVSVNGTTVKSFSETATSLYPPYSINAIKDWSFASVTVSQPRGQSVTIPISTGGMSLANYNYSSQSRYIGGGTVNVTLPAIEQYKVTASVTHGSAVIQRTASPSGGATGSLQPGADIYVGDTLTIGFSMDAGYAPDDVKVNGVSITGSTYTMTVSGDVSITSGAKLQGMVYINNEAYIPYIDNGTTWEQYIPELDNGSGWDICS